VYSLILTFHGAFRAHPGTLRVPAVAASAGHVISDKCVQNQSNSSLTPSQNAYGEWVV